MIIKRKTKQVTKELHGNQKSRRNPRTLSNWKCVGSTVGMERACERWGWGWKGRGGFLPSRVRTQKSLDNDK